MGFGRPEIHGAVVVSISLQDLVSGAANLFLASSNRTAIQAAKLIKSASLQRSSDPPRRLEILRHLQSVTLPRLEGDYDSLVLKLVQQLPWTDGGFDLPDEISGRNAYAELVGPEGPFLSEHCRFGFYLQAPECLYPAHSHAAEEFYLILSGSVEWRLDGTEPFIPSVPGLVHHRPWQKHEMGTGRFPLLAMWAWVGDIRYGTYSI
jgi:hypothetical protein